MSAWKVILATLVIFVAGAVTGMVVAKKLGPQSEAGTRRFQAILPRPLRAEFLQRMNRELELTSEQQVAVSNVVHDSQERVRILYELINPDLVEEMRLTREEIRGLLTAEQRQKHDNFQRKRVRRSKASGDRGSERSRPGRAKKTGIEPAVPQP